MKDIERSWLWLGIGSLAVAGLYAILIVALRTPGVHQFFPHGFFRVSLIIHVNLSVLVWLLSMACHLSSSLIDVSQKMTARSGVISGWIGTLAMMLSPCIGKATPITNNYIPMLHHVLFMFGLGMIACAVLCQLGAVFLSRPKLISVKDHGMMGAMVILLATMLAFTISHWQLDAIQTKQHDTLYHYYEMLFWGGGHLLQFVYTQLAMVAWLILLTAMGKQFSISETFQKILLWGNVVLAVAGLGVYGMAEVHEVAYITGFTHHMRFAGGVVPLLWMLFLMIALTSPTQQEDQPSEPVISATMTMSLLLFIAGGILGYAIRGSNVVIPAHYHGSIIGISLALMGVAYVVIPMLGGQKIEGRWARWQPYLYGGGQLMHIAGLAWSGGYGALRKTAGEPLAMSAKIGMGFMGAGGLLSIIGGVMFVWFAGKSLYYVRSLVKEAPSI